MFNSAKHLENWDCKSHKVMKHTAAAGRNQSCQEIKHFPFITPSYCLEPLLTVRVQGWKGLILWPPTPQYKNRTICRQECLGISFVLDTFWVLFLAICASAGARRLLRPSTWAGPAGTPPPTLKGTGHQQLEHALAPAATPKPPRSTSSWRLASIIRRLHRQWEQTLPGPK